MTMNVIDRRTLLSRGMTGSLVIGAGGLSAPRLAFGQETGSKKLLFVILRGAADGLSMLAPVGDPDFARLRRRSLREYENARKADSFFAIHPTLENIGQAYSEGEALFVHAAATAYRERSHFDGQNVLETGGSSPFSRRDGWLNRLASLIAAKAGRQPKALAVALTMPLALRGDAPASNYAPTRGRSASADFMDRVGKLYENDPQLGNLLSQALETREMAGDTEMRNLRDYQKTGELAASLMRSEDGAQIGMVELNGWDSHVNQIGVFRRQAGQLDALIGAYRSAMGSEWSNTMVLVATEFGRTVRINGTNGTDHGTGSAAIVLGGGVRGKRVIADWPGLADNQLFENRDLRPTTSLQSVFAGSVSEHLGFGPRETMSRLYQDAKEAPLKGITRA
ncbi:DUF1501 domain-containing protein [Erythrobacter crassostreae]|uniref:DUF1501 domain-containing protein n=1 Tax=Erythrobacter crassostreae TaxID=2828328 RepID=A0A9X1F3G7_9SPHN|nr:DUF1501 domain-containing protein [Erythrobacter crassostrea]MBV7259606.1 DUF1501 domain-containing protein [Erythrobacter crassostrea]